jgi:hypothetical protein
MGHHCYGNKRVGSPSSSDLMLWTLRFRRFPFRRSILQGGKADGWFHLFAGLFWTQLFLFTRCIDYIRSFLLCGGKNRWGGRLWREELGFLNCAVMADSIVL